MWGILDNTGQSGAEGRVKGRELVIFHAQPTSYLYVKLGDSEASRRAFHGSRQTFFGGSQTSASDLRGDKAGLDIGVLDGARVTRYD